MTIAITRSEVVSLAPLASLSLVYWLRDKYMYNRAGGRWYTSTATQKKVLLFVWPVWLFLGWTLGLQTNRGHVAAALFTTAGQHVAGHYTVIGVLNDSFNMTRQQLISFFLGLVLALIWTAYWLVVTESGNEIDHVERNHTHCDCNR